MLSRCALLAFLQVVSLAKGHTKLAHPTLQRLARLVQQGHLPDSLFMLNIGDSAVCTPCESVQRTLALIHVHLHSYTHSALFAHRSYQTALHLIAVLIERVEGQHAYRLVSCNIACARAMHPAAKQCFLAYSHMWSNSLLYRILENHTFEPWHTNRISTV